MTLNVPELDRQHRQTGWVRGVIGVKCQACGVTWPCSARSLLDLVAQQNKALAQIEDMTTDYVGTSQAAGDIAKVARAALDAHREACLPDRQGETELCPKCSKYVPDCAREGCGINFTGEGECACRGETEGGK